MGQFVWAAWAFLYHSASSVILILSFPHNLRCWTKHQLPFLSVVMYITCIPIPKRGLSSLWNLMTVFNVPIPVRILVFFATIRMPVQRIQRLLYMFFLWQTCYDLFCGGDIFPSHTILQHGVHVLSIILLTTLKVHSVENNAPVILPVKYVTVCDCRISGREIQ